MRTLLAALVLAAATTAAHAEVIDNFTYAYTLNGDNFSNTFTLVDGQTPDAITVVESQSFSAHSYNIILNQDPNQLAVATFYTNPGTEAFNLSTTNFGTTFSDYSLSMTDFYTGGDLGLKFTPQIVEFLSAKVTIGDSTIPFDSSSLTITQTTVPDPTPIAATPEPASLSLFGTGLLGLGTLVRRRLLA